MAFKQWRQSSSLLASRLCIHFIYHNRLKAQAMRSLIAPALFWVAKVGLCVSISWMIVSFYIDFQLTVFDVSVIIESASVTIANCVPHGDWIFITEAEGNFFGYPRWSYGKFGQDHSVYAAGIYIAMYQQDYIFGIELWLIITMFALLYAVLKFIHRQQPEGEPCED